MMYGLILLKLHSRTSNQMCWKNSLLTDFGYFNFRKNVTYIVNIHWIKNIVIKIHAILFFYIFE